MRLKRICPPVKLDRNRKLRDLIAIVAGTRISETVRMLGFLFASFRGWMRHSDGVFCHAADFMVALA